MKTIEKQLLVALSTGELKASELRDRLGLEQNQQVHYRVKKLQEYIETVDEEPQRGAAKSAKVYTLNEAGEKWVEKHRDDVTLSSLDEAEELVSELLSEVSELRESFEEATERHQRESGHYSQLRSQVEELEDELHETSFEVSDARGRLQRLSDAVDDIESRLGAIESDVSQLESRQSDVVDITERLDNLEARVENLESYAEDKSEVVNSLRERVQELESQPSGILDLLFS